jgi:hypothetical protein
MSKFNKGVSLFKQRADIVLTVAIKLIGVFAVRVSPRPETLHNWSNMTDSIPHHYYPPSIRLPHYAANETSVLSLIAQFGFLWAAVLGIAFIAIQRVGPAVSRSDQLAFIWMCLSMLP